MKHGQLRERTPLSASLLGICGALICATMIFSSEEAYGQIRTRQRNVSPPEAPKVEAPKVEAPKVEAPKVEAPKVEAPKVEAPKVEAPKTRTPDTGVNGEGKSNIPSSEKGKGTAEVTEDNVLKYTLSDGTPNTIDLKNLSDANKLELANIAALLTVGQGLNAQSCQALSEDSCIELIIRMMSQSLCSTCTTVNISPSVIAFMRQTYFPTPGGAGVGTDIAFLETLKAQLEVRIKTAKNLDDAHKAAIRAQIAALDIQIKTLNDLIVKNNDEIRDNNDKISHRGAREKFRIWRKKSLERKAARKLKKAKRIEDKLVSYEADRERLRLANTILESTNQSNRTQISLLEIQKARVQVSRPQTPVTTLNTSLTLPGASQGSGLILSTGGSVNSGSAYVITIGGQGNRLPGANLPGVVVDSTTGRYVSDLSTADINALLNGSNGLVYKGKGYRNLLTGEVTLTDPVGSSSESTYGRMNPNVLGQKTPNSPSSGNGFSYKAGTGPSHRTTYSGNGLGY